MKKNNLLIIGVATVLILLGFAVLNGSILNSSKNIISKFALTPTPKVLAKLNVVYVLNNSAKPAIAVAMKNKIFEKYGLEVKTREATNGNMANKSLISGESDLAIGLQQSYLMAAANGAKIKTIGVVNNNFPWLFVSSKELKDIKIVGTTGKSSETYLRSAEMLKALGVDVKSINFIDLGSTDLVGKALVAGSIDATSFTEIAWVRLKKQSKLGENYKVFAKASGVNYLVKPTGIMVSEDVFKNKKELIEDFVKAILEANDWIKNNSVENVTKTISGVNRVTKEDASLFAQFSKEDIKNVKFTPKLSDLEAIKQEILPVSPKLKDYDVKNFVSFETSDSLKAQGFLQKYNF